MNNIAVIVPVYNRKNITLNYLFNFTKISSTKNDYTFNIIIVDDGSDDETSQKIRESFPRVIVLAGDGNLWWTGAIKMGVDYAIKNNYDAMLIMNDDVEMAPDFLDELLHVHATNKNALVSSIKLNKQKNGKEQIITAGFKVVGWLKQTKIIHADEFYSANMNNIIDCDILTGSSLLIPADIFQNIGNFDNTTFPHHWGDFEFTRRASLAGYKCLVATKSKIYTEYNPNYALPYMLKSTRLDYLRNLFNNTRHFYGFQSIVKTSFMHKNSFVGLVLFIKRFMGLLKLIVLKIFLPNHVLKKLFQPKGYL